MPADVASSYTSARLVQVRIAVSTVFFLTGAAYGMWGVHIPSVQQRLGIDPAVLGLALLCIGFGAVLSQPIMGRVVERVGSRAATRISALVFAVVFPTPILAPNPLLLFVATFAFGATAGLVNVAMNTQASEVESARGAPTMSSFHGFFSLGALAGSVGGGVIVEAGWGDGSGALAVAALVFAGYAMAGAYFLQSAPPKAKEGPSFALPTRALMVVAGIAFLCNMIEGAVVDWSALFLVAEKGASPGGAAIGLAMFMLTMAACRLFSSPVVQRLGATATVTIGSLVIAAGIGVALAAPWPWLSAVGFGLVGIGAANNLPVLIGAGGSTPGVSASVGVAAVTTAALVGFLISPPLIGFVSNELGLSAGLSILAVVALAAAAASALRHQVDRVT